MRQTKTGILLANLGTPDAPTPEAVKRYLKQFLSDRRVVDTSRLLWWPLLRGVIVPAPAVAAAVNHQRRATFHPDRGIQLRHTR
ncbi:ferrochelatase, partial [Bacillus sp. HC-TM]